MNIGASEPCLSSHDQTSSFGTTRPGRVRALVMFSRSRSRWSLTVVTHVDRFVCASYRSDSGSSSGSGTSSAMWSCSADPLSPVSHYCPTSAIGHRQGSRLQDSVRGAAPRLRRTGLRPLRGLARRAGGALGWAIPGTCDHCTVRRADRSWANVSLNVHYPTGGRSLVHNRREAYLRPDQVRRT